MAIGRRRGNRGAPPVQAQQTSQGLGMAPPVGLIGSEQALQAGLGGFKQSFQGGLAGSEQALRGGFQGGLAALDAGNQGIDIQAALAGLRGNEAQGQAFQNFQSSPAIYVARKKRSCENALND